MGKHVRQCDMKVMKMAMLKHEETFRQQVHELHRLYRIQTQLMAGDLSTRRQPRRPGNKQPRRVLNLQLPPDQYLVGAEDEDDEELELELELTLAVGGRISSPPKKRGDAKYSAGGRFASGCSGGTSLSSPSQPSSVGYSWGAAGVALHGYAPLRRPCQRTMAFDLGMEEAMKQHQSPWQLVQCQYPSLRMT